MIYVRFILIRLVTCGLGSDRRKPTTVSSVISNCVYTLENEKCLEVLLQV